MKQCIFIKKTILFAITLFVLMGFSNYVFAGAPQIDPGQFDATASGFQHFYAGVGSSIKSIIESPTLNNFSLTLWKFFSVMLLIWSLTQYAMRGLDFAEIFGVVFMILITRILMLQYDALTTALWSWSESFASGIQMAAIGVSDQLFAPRYIWNLMTSFDWPAENFLFHPLDVIASIILSLVSAILCVLGFFSAVWALWGYSLAKMIGFMFIPTLLFERMSWLFDGWLRFFFGFLIYNVIAKASLMLVVIALHAYLSLPVDLIPTHMGWSFTFNSILDLCGLLTFLILSIIGLLSTPSFVRSIVSGSQVGSLAGGARSLAQGAQSLARNVAGMTK